MRNERKPHGAPASTEKDEPRDEEKDDQPRTEIDDLDVPPEESEDVKGGKVQMQDNHFKRIDKTSPS